MKVGYLQRCKETYWVLHIYGICCQDPKCIDRRFVTTQRDDLDRSLNDKSWTYVRMTLGDRYGIHFVAKDLDHQPHCSCLPVLALLARDKEGELDDVHDQRPYFENIQCNMRADHE